MKFNPKRLFFKEESINYFHDEFSLLTSPHKHEDKNYLKTHLEKETCNHFKLFKSKTFYFQILTFQELTNIS